jgi:8-oxo-dGTP diphosphatase
MPAWAIIEEQQKILMVKRSKHTSRPEQWCIPGGGIKSTESPQQACIRECKEEVGLDIEVVKLMDNQSMGHVFRCRLVDHQQSICLNQAECVDSAWVKPEELLSLGQIMDFKVMYGLLLEAGYQVQLNSVACQRLNE